MYIKLGTTNLNYSTSLDDYMIVSEVVDSQLSYENPVLVRNKDELDVWFGKEFSSRNYFDELLQQGITLYLYKPILSSNIRDKNYVDLSQYQEDPKTYYNIEEIEDPQPGTIYKLVNHEQYIYINNELINIDLLPQNLDNNSSSLNNRDTLYLTRSGNICHPDFSYSEMDLGHYSNTPTLEHYYDVYDNFNNETETIVFKVRYTGNDNQNQLLDNGYIIITNLSVDINDDYINDYTEYVFIDNKLIVKPEDLDTSQYTIDETRYYSVDEIENPEQEIIYKVYKDRTYFNNSKFGYLCHTTEYTEDKYLANYTFNDYKSSTPKHTNTISTFQELINIYRMLGYTCESLNNDNTEYLVYSNEGYITNLTYFYTIPNIEIENDFKANNNILYDYYNESLDLGIKFWSKTIGTCDDNIKVKIETIKYDTTRITLTRFDYSEIFEGPLYPDENEERLDYVISKYSKLVYCEFNPRLLDSVYKFYISHNNNDNVLLCSDFYIKFDEDVNFHREGEETTEIIVNVRQTDRKFYNLVVNTPNESINLVYRINGYLSGDHIAEYEFCDFGLPNGEYVLLGSITEDQEGINYKKGLEYMFDTNKVNTYPDFIFIPDQYKFPENSNEELFLPIAKEYNLQVLIENKKSKYNYSDKDPGEKNRLPNTIYKVNIEDSEEFIYVLNENIFDVSDQDNLKILEIAIAGGDFIYNYNDKDNRLVYFFDSMMINYNTRPGYYLHVLGVLGNIFSMSSRYILYDQPSKNDPYEIDKNTLLNELEKYKSNYLIFNNHMYYYKKYLSGENYNCTIWMRFILGKIERELNKNKGYFLTQKSMGFIKNTIESVLRKIMSRFSIVKSITLTKFIPKLNENYLSLGIETQINDLVDNNVKLNLTINI